MRSWKKAKSIISPSWNVLAICARKDMSQRLYSVNAPVRVFPTLCKAFGKGGIFRWNPAIPFCKANRIAE